VRVCARDERGIDPDGFADPLDEDEERVRTSLLLTSPIGGASRQEAADVRGMQFGGDPAERMNQRSSGITGQRTREVHLPSFVRLDFIRGL
jgi:hypothetical protein